MSIPPNRLARVHPLEAASDDTFVDQLTRRVIRDHDLAARRIQIFRELTAARSLRPIVSTPQVHDAGAAGHP